MIYLAFTGLGKTTFCKNNPSWFDFDLESFSSKEGGINCNNIELIKKMIDNYTKYGYNILMSAVTALIPIFASMHYEFTVFLPEDTPEMREEILKRITGRYENFKDTFPDVLKNNYDLIYYGIKQMAEYFKFPIYYLKPNEYLSDILPKIIESK